LQKTPSASIKSRKFQNDLMRDSSMLTVLGLAPFWTGFYDRCWIGKVFFQGSWVI
jgi:hypothetical protein